MHEYTVMIEVTDLISVEATSPEEAIEIAKDVFFSNARSADSIEADVVSGPRSVED